MIIEIRPEEMDVIADEGRCHHCDHLVVLHSEWGGKHSCCVKECWCEHEPVIAGDQDGCFQCSEWAELHPDRVNL